MDVSLVLTVIGDDRPGLVDSLSTAVADHGGSWQESHMVQLAGKFAGILRAEVPQEQAASLEATLRQLASAGLHVVVEASAQHPVALSRTLHLELLVMTTRASSATSPACWPPEKSTSTSSAPSLQAPADGSVEDLRETLEVLANDLMVAITLDESADSAA